MTKDLSTPRPWLLKGKLTITKCGSMTKLDHVIATVKNHLSGFDLCGERLEQEANARLIIKAVNCHDELVESLKEMTGIVMGMDNEDYIGRSKQALEALTKAVQS